MARIGHARRRHDLAIALECESAWYIPCRAAPPPSAAAPSRRAARRTLALIESSGLVSAACRHQFVAVAAVSAPQRWSAGSLSSVDTMVSRKSSPIGGRYCGKHGPRWKAPQNDGWQGRPLSTLHGARAGGSLSCAERRGCDAAGDGNDTIASRRRPCHDRAQRSQHPWPPSLLSASAATCMRTMRSGLGRRLAALELVDHVHAARPLRRSRCTGR